MIKLENVNLKLGQFSMLDFNLNIEKGEYFVVLGPSGTGKTVLLEVIAGLNKVKSGKIVFNNKLMNNIPPEKRNVGMVYQNYLLFPHLSVKENIKFGFNFKTIQNSKEKYKNILKLLDISDIENRNIHKLSGGEKQRVALARTLITEPEILLLDEPLSSVDKSTKDKLKYDLKKIHNKYKTTTIHVTHDFEEAIFLADKIAIINTGNIIQIGKPEEIFHKPNSEFIANFIGCKNIFSGEIIKNNLVKINKEINFSISSNVKGKVRLMIKSENIIVSKEKIKSSAKNSFLGKIIKINRRISIVEVIVDIGTEISAYITYSSFENLKLKKNSEVFITFKATSVHIF